MKAAFPLLFLTLTLGSCKKNDNDSGSSTRCLETTVLQTNFVNKLEAVFFLNGKDGFVADYTGGIYKTTDSAKTWVSLNSTVNLPVYDLYFTDAQKGYAVGGWSFCNGTGCTPPGGFILRTLDGGQSWTRVHTPSEKIEIRSIHFVTPSLGFCAGGNMILKTTDGGQTWSEYKVNNPGGFITEIRFVNAQEGYAASLFSQVLKTADGGQTWVATPLGYNNGYYALATPNGTLYLSGQGKMLKSINKGSSWMELANSPSDIFDLHFVDDKRGFAFGRGNWSGGDFGSNYGAIYCTNNGGETWSGTSEVKQTGLIEKVSFPSNNLGYAISGINLIRFTDK
jgi:photosystem II stability/assembly factor-like uncharacterized protein